ncbi:MAG: hypothetical protein JW995_11860 [Melioribacteraceae bacterium]|nr:hypothetical protein [Melioribacteraceae bacterium]
MGGKASILIVLGFSTIFLFVGYNFNRLTVDSVDNFSDYFEKTISHNIAISGANIAANKIFFDNNWADGFQDIPFSGGTYSTYVNASSTTITVTTISSYKGYIDTVRVILQPSKFSKFAYYSAYEPSNIWWTSGDTVWGPMHVQGDLNVAYEPVFFGKVTCQNDLNTYGHYEWKYVQVSTWRWEWRQVWVSDSDPQFLGGFENGVDLPMPADGVSNVELVSAGGAKFTGQDTVFLTFDTDSIKFRFSKNDPDTSVLATSFAPNGVIFAQNSVLRLKGTVKGAYTVGVSSNSISNGKVFLDDDLIYETDPQVNPASTDMLGIVAKNDIMITNNTANNSNINIHASMYSESGGFGAEDYASRPVGGNINLLGGIQQSTRRAVGTFSSGGTVSGFNKRYMYDDRFMLASPPAFPGTGAFEIVSWYE